LFEHAHSRRSAEIFGGAQEAERDPRLDELREVLALIVGFGLAPMGVGGRNVIGMACASPAGISEIA